MVEAKKCSHPDASLASPVFGSADRDIVSFYCNKCGERVERDLSDGPIVFGADDTTLESEVPDVE